jgi:energy-coupling factor transporter ATP-binding protein EcfA2
MTALAARGVCKSFGRRRVLAGADLDVAPGELVAVVGENGTGKTTLLRILAGDLRPDVGTVATSGRPGYCPQTAVLDEALTVDQHVRYFQAVPTRQPSPTSPARPHSASSPIGHQAPLASGTSRNTQPKLTRPEKSPRGKMSYTSPRMA